MTVRTIEDLLTDDGQVDISELRSRVHDLEDFYIHGIDGGSIGDYHAAWGQLRRDLYELQELMENGSD